MLSEKTEGGFSDGRIAEDGIELCADEEDVHAGIEPEHTENNSGQTAVDGGIVAYVIDIEGKQKGKTDPACSRENCAGELAENGGFPVGQ